MTTTKEAPVIDHPDKGCELHPSCLDCPMPVCVEEIPCGKRNLLKFRRALQIIKLRQQGTPIRALCEQFRVSRSTVERALKLFKSNA